MEAGGPHEGMVRSRETDEEKCNEKEEEGEKAKENRGKFM